MRIFLVLCSEMIQNIIQYEQVTEEETENLNYLKWSLIKKGLDDCSLEDYIIKN
jgi:hypothetical protein